MISKMPYDLEDNLGYHIGKTFKIMHYAIQKLLENGGFDISSDQWIVMIFIYHKGSTSQQFLARIVSKDKATITRVIDDLEKKNYVSRIPGKVDRREKMISLTKSGEQYARKIFPFMQKWSEDMTNNITAKEFESLKKTLKKITDNIIKEMQPVCKNTNYKFENNN
jgi:DNA-binding MarR family transcriptional regulator